MALGGADGGSVANDLIARLERFCVIDFGTTTGFTTGNITTVETTVSVNYGPGQVATFANQLVAGPMSEGSSGSLIVAADSQTAVGLLFAGSAQSTIFSPIQAVLGCLNVDI